MGQSRTPWPWLPFGLGLVVLSIGGCVAVPLGVWELVMMLCIECGARDAPWLPGVILLAAAVLAAGAGGMSLWRSRGTESPAPEASDSLISASVLLVFVAVGAGAVAVAWLFLMS